MDFCGLLLGIIIIVAIWIFTGHFLWEVGRILFGHSNKVDSQPVIKKQPINDPLKDFAGAERLLDYSSFRGWIETDELQSLRLLMADLRVRINEEKFSDSASVQLGTVKQSVAPERPQSIRAAIEPPPAQTLQPTKSHPLETEELQTISRSIRQPATKRLKTNLLRSFMERSNIRWIELISAALIVVCSVGLVISLWSPLSKTSRFFPSIVFMLAAIAVHAAGLYTLKKWKLRSTSRGILQIGLMLIPLSVLVSILLVKRDGQPPQFTFIVGLMLCIGMAVYGGLAKTASQALYGRRWPWITSLTVLASLSLVFSYWLGNVTASRSLAQAILTSTLTLFPSIVVAVGLVMLLNRSILDARKPSGRACQRSIAIVAQVIFALGIAIGFAFLQWKHDAILLAALWIPIAGALGVLIAWGTANSQSLLNRPDDTKTTTTTLVSVLAILSWLIALGSLIGLSAVVWQGCQQRLSLICALAAVGIIWVIHGAFVRTITNVVGGCIALLYTSVLASEITLGTSAELSPIDWVSSTRVVAITLISIGAMAFSTIAIMASKLQFTFLHPREIRSWSFAGPNRRWFHLKSLEMNFFSGLAAAGAVLFITSALLSVLACLVNKGPTPLGGNWAPALLLLHSMICIVVSLAVESRTVKNTKPQVAYLCVLGQVFGLIGTLRLTQSSPVLSDLLGYARPAHAWAIGLALLAVTWSLIALIYKLRTRRDKLKHETVCKVIFNVPISLCCGSIALIICSAIGLWLPEPSADMFYAVRFGWTLPVVIGCAWLVVKSAVLREFCVLGLIAWSCVLLWSVQLNHDWYLSLGSVGVVAITSILALTLAASCAALFKPMKPRSDSRLQSEALGFSLPSVIVISIVGLLIVSFAPALHNAELSFKRAVDANLASSIGNTAFVALGIALICHLAMSVGLFYRDAKVLAWVILGNLPFLIATGLSAWLANLWSYPAMLWTLGIAMTFSEVIPLCVPRWRGESDAAWENVFSNSSSDEPQSTLSLGLQTLRFGLSLVLLATLFLNTFAAVSGSLILPAGYLPLSTALLWIGPWLLALAVRWSRCAWTGDSKSMMTSVSIVLAVTVTLVDWIATKDGLDSKGALAVAAIRCLQVGALSASVLAWLMLGLCLIRNTLSLRAMDASKTLLAHLKKSRKGARYRRVEAATFVLAGLSLSAVTILGFAAAYFVVLYPKEVLPGLTQIGGPLSIALYVVALPIACWQLLARGATKFGMLGVGLGLLAPLLSAIYARGLIQNPSWQYRTANDFEPYRLINTLWLISLAIGLAMRCVKRPTTVRNTVFAEALWIAIALVCGFLSFVASANDPNFWWSVCQLSVLAVLATISSVASDQLWRGHIAAVLAAAAVLIGVNNLGLKLNFIVVAWLTLLGPVSVAFLSIVVRSISNKNKLHSRRTVEASVSLTVPISYLLLAATLIFFDGWSLQQITIPDLWLILASVTVLILSAIRWIQPITWVQFAASYAAIVSIVSCIAMVFCVNTELTLEVRWLVWTASLAAATTAMAFVLREVTETREGLLKRFSEKTRAIFRFELHRVHRWMPALHTAIGGMLLIPTIDLVLTTEFVEVRRMAALLPFLIAGSVLAIAKFNYQKVWQRIGLAFMSLSILLFAVASLSVSWLEHVPGDVWLFLQRVLAAGVLLSWIYWIIGGLTSTKKSDSFVSDETTTATKTTTTGAWSETLKIFSWILLAIALMAGLALNLVALLGQHRAAIAQAELFEKVLLIGGFIAIFARLIQAAGYPAGIDRGLSMLFRTTAVYVAEFTVAAIVSAIYFCYPDLFSGIVANWWPVIVFGVAMLSLGLGQTLAKTQLEILSDPVSRSALLLPVIPLVGVWWFKLRGIEIASSWAQFEDYSLLLLSAGGLYGLHSWFSRSIAFRFVSAAFLLFAFWMLLYSAPNLRFFEHPQFWLLPPAVASLGFVEWNRQRLTETSVTATRYVAILVAYLSSTAEMLMRAFDGQFWPPLILLMVSLVGVVLGFLMRIRPFLYCGAAFVFVALLGMVWHAQQAIDQIWPWWAFGIVLGICLIALRGYIEKNRAEVSDYLESLRAWQ